MEGFAKTGRTVTGLGLGIGLSLWTAKILFVDSLSSPPLLLSFPLPLSAESSFAGLGLDDFRFFNGFLCEFESFGSIGLAEIDFGLAVCEVGSFSLVVSVPPESSESTTNSELSEGLVAVAGFTALALGFFAGNKVDLFGPAMTLQAWELYPCWYCIVYRDDQEAVHFCMWYILKLL